ncbi:MAG: hypothetical protein NTU49_07720 [Gammaproteobacteria bacterium]|nr:hypothetical protein [Gammaproteobacteria bacterium]
MQFSPKLKRYIASVIAASFVFSTQAMAGGFLHVLKSSRFLLVRH